MVYGCTKKLDSLKKAEKYFLVVKQSSFLEQSCCWKLRHGKQDDEEDDHEPDGQKELIDFDLKRFSCALLVNLIKTCYW